jgi:hypothetical protein
LDCETSSASIASGGRLIQAGLAVWSGDHGTTVEVFSSLVHQTEMEWSPEAAAVHNIDRSRIERAPSAVEVDAAASAWLIERGAVPGERTVVPVGLNVGSFDLPFFAQALPRTSSLLSHRVVDLNSLCFAFDGWSPAGPNAAVGFQQWKQAMKATANAALAAQGWPADDHDAGFDAAQALLGFWWLRSQFAGPATPPGDDFHGAPPTA